MCLIYHQYTLSSCSPPPLPHLFPSSRLISPLLPLFFYYSTNTPNTGLTSALGLSQICHPGGYSHGNGGHEVTDVPRVCRRCAHEEGSPPVLPLPPPPYFSSFTKGGVGVGVGRESRGKFFAITKLDKTAHAGSHELECNVPEGCVPGILVVIGEGLAHEEKRLIVGFASILVDRPLSHTHPAGTSITIYDPHQLAVGFHSAVTTTTSTTNTNTNNHSTTVFDALHHNQRHTEVMRKTHHQHRQRESEQAPYRPTIPSSSQDIVMRRYVSRDTSF